ncbi:response regulator rcp1 [mine drainage metagenome]|uniref:Response regulator rcp1 n=1 Tax=mine drainage metagenome TaxID=410659 RepID=A0A1J5T692_9ZZZZ
MQPCILLVDDDPIGAELTMAALAELNLGLPVQLAVDGEEALDLLMRRKPMDPGAACPPYLVLLDLKMPKVDGHEVLRQIRESDQLRALRVIVLTSSDQKSDMERSRELGTDAYLLKPPSIFDLIDEFRKLEPLFQPPTKFTC